MNRIELLETYAVLAHDYGLYGIFERIRRMGFRSRPSLRYETLSETQQEHYHALADSAAQTDPWDSKLYAV